MYTPLVHLQPAMVIPEIINNYAQYANPYKVSHAHGLAIEQTGKLLVGGSWKKITSLLDVDYPLIQFNRTMKSFLFKQQKGIRNNEAFSATTTMAVSKSNLESSTELLEAEILNYLSLLPWMPWAFTSDHVQIEEIENNAISVWLSSYPHIKGVFLFSEESKIHSFNADRPRWVVDHWEMNQWMVLYGKYNIKKSYKVPTEVTYSWSDGESTEEYLQLEKITGFTVL